MCIRDSLHHFDLTLYIIRNIGHFYGNDRQIMVRIGTLYISRYHQVITVLRINGKAYGQGLCSGYYVVIRCNEKLIIRLTDEMCIRDRFLMLLNCGIYAIAWQMVMKKFDLSTAYANKSVYLIWSQLWAVLIFKESLSINNIIGMLVVFLGVMVVSGDE